MTRYLLAALIVFGASGALPGCSGAGMSQTRLRGSEFTAYRETWVCDVRSRYYSACMEEAARRTRASGTYTTRVATGFSLAALLGYSSSTTDGDSQGGLAVDLYIEGFVGRNRKGVGVRGGYLYQGGGGRDGVPHTGYQGWDVQPLVYLVPSSRLVVYGGPGVVFGKVKFGNDQRREAIAFRALGGVHFDVLRIFGGSWTLAAEMSWLRAGAGDDGPGYSGTAITFGSLATF